MNDKQTLRAQFEAADASRAALMERVRKCAALSDPTMLPLIGTTQNVRLMRSYQGLGANILSNIASKLIMAVFPPNMPSVRLKPSARIRVDPYTTQEGLDILQKHLYARELLWHSTLDTTKYRTKFLTAFKHTIGVGNSLTRCGGENGDYWFKNFRFDHFVQKRGSDHEVLWTTTLEKKDPLELSDKDLAKADLNREELEKKTGEDRPQSLFTRCTRQREAKNWVVEQELNDKIIRTSQEPVSPDLVLGYKELPGEDYSRGLIEEMMGDLSSFNTLYRNLLDWSTNASKVTPVLDPSNSYDMTPADLTKPSGEVVLGRVMDGKVQGAAFLSTNMASDLSVVLNHADRIERRLGKQGLLETEAQRKAERVTATEVMRVARQLEGALGAIYAEIASEVQRTLYDRMIYQMERDKLLPPLPSGLEGAVDVEILTGLEALGRQVELEKLMGALQLILPVPELAARLSPERLLAMIFRGYNLDMAQVVKTAEEMQAEAEARMAEQAQAAAAQQAISSAGAITEERAKQATAQAAQPPV